jgi:GNAT superfamily N-acetyltransferase
MADMLVKLYELPPLQPALDALASINIAIRRAEIGEEHVIKPWIAKHFKPGWAAGIAFAIYRSPGSFFVAIQKALPDPNRSDPYDLPPERLVGFACYDTSSRGMFGPMGVQKEFEGRGIGKALLLASLHAMREEHYAYAIIGWAGPVDWYAKTVGATIISGSEPGPFRGKLLGGTEKYS